MRPSERWAMGLCAVLVVAGCAGKVTELGGKPDAGHVNAGPGGAGGAGGAGGLRGTGGSGAPGDIEGGVGGGAAGGGGVSGSGGGGGSGPTSTVTHSNKLDLLLMVDNSISMADKQKVLNSTIPDLVQRLTAASPGVTDLHIAVISSSLGDHGGGSVCVGHDSAGSAPADLRDQEQNDHGHLITTRPRGAGLGVPDVISWTSKDDVGTLTKQIQDVVGAVGEYGCGLEAQLESMYRFLVDPSPPLAIVSGPCPAPNTSQKCAFPTGLDSALLAQRAEFLRTDSAVAVMILTDENDCSIRDEKQYFYAAMDPSQILLPHGSSACATNPNDPCCYSCGTSRPSNCPLDPTCASPTGTLSQDALNLRCFHEKQRFGLDFLYPIQRYVTALTQTQLCTSSPDLLSPPTGCDIADLRLNQLFIGGDGNIRDPSLVSVLGLVGVPWQDLAAAGPANELHFKAPGALAADHTWDAILGDPAASPPLNPSDGLMVESRLPRAGNDITGTPIPGPQAPSTSYNAMNRHEWADVANDDLEYACIFPLTESRDCTVVEAQSLYEGCDCGALNDPADNNPLCQSPTTGVYGTTQYYAKAYPGIRELSLLKALGTQGLTASVCPRNLTDDSASDYGYRPAIDLLINQLKNTTP